MIKLSANDLRRRGACWSACNEFARLFAGGSWRRRVAVEATKKNLDALDVSLHLNSWSAVGVLLRGDHHVAWLKDAHTHYTKTAREARLLRRNLKKHDALWTRHRRQLWLSLIRRLNRPGALREAER